MKVLKRIWDYFFPMIVSLPTVNIIEKKMKDEVREVKFCEPFSPEQKFKESKTLSDFIKKIDNQ